jgi:NitT/TauT family transport system substrate-binding protein
VPASSPSTKLKVGISDPVNTVLAIWMADAAGFYAANDLTVEVTNMNGGSRGAAEVEAGRIDLMHVGLSSVIRLNRGGADLRIIAALANVIRFAFVAAPDVKTAAQLKGSVVGVSTFGSESDSTVTLALKRLGLSRDDVVLKEYGGGTQRLAALKSGEIKATAVNEPFSSMAREQGVNVLVDLVPEHIPWLFTALVVKRQTIAARRDALSRFIQATAEGNYLALTNEKLAKEVLSRQAGIIDPKILDIGYNDFKLLSPPNIEPTDAAAKNVLVQFPDASQRVEDYIDGSVLDGLRKNGVFTALQQKYRG